MQEYAAIAELYAIDFADIHEDVDFYRSLALHSNGPILECMCGTGRILAPLARAGYTVTGIDSSAEMIAVAHRTLADTPATLIQADIRTWQSDTRYGLAIVALNSFMHMTTTSDQLEALATIHDALLPGGRLVIDVFNPDVRSIPAYRGDVVLDRQFTLADGRHVQKFVVQWADIVAQQIHVVFMYDINEQHHVKRVSASFTMRWLWRFEAEHLLARAGFVLEHVYGDYELGPLSNESEQMILVARKRGRR
ncbi:MAG: class I SAM-dependent methyltransferase [Roseiflexaceae bacterium]|jgi:SAM-dependent methyltransferase|nr:class I SAM-dependent methyltransferase [Chloroflexaceae bacterium]